MSPPDDTDQKTLHWLLLAALAVWSTNLFLNQNHLSDDRDAYLQIARNLTDTGTFSRTLPDGTRCPTAYRPPLYPFMLAASGGFRSVRPLTTAALHLLALLALVILVHRTGCRMSRRVGMAAGAMVAVDPILLHWSTFPMTETVAVALGAAIVWGGTAVWESPGPIRGASRPWWRTESIRHAAFGLLCGLATLCRPVFAVWSLLVMMAVAVILRAHRPWSRLAYMAAGMALVLVPWSVRNARIVGRATPLTTHGGYTLLLGNNPDFYQHVRHRGWRATWDAGPLQRRIKEEGVIESPACSFEPSNDRRCYALAQESIRHDPWGFVRASAARIARLWNPMPLRVAPDESAARRWFRWLVGGWYTAIFVLAALGVLRLGLPAARRRARRAANSLAALLASPLILIGALGCIAFTLVHTVYWSNMRMRAPLMPWIYLAAATEWIEMIHRRRS